MTSSDHLANEVNPQHINSLPNSINTLQTEVAQLLQERKQDKLEVESLRRETSALKLSISNASTRSDKVFTLFPKLAKELRTIIWDTFLETPQVVGVRIATVRLDTVKYVGQRLAVPIGQHSVLRQVNKESRREAKRFQSGSGIITQTTSIPVPKIFFNPHIDTLWLADGKFSDIHFGRQYDIFSKDLRIEKLALHAETFLRGLRHHGDRQVFEVFFTLWKMRSSAIDLVVGNNHVSKDSNVKFIPPRGGPLEYFASMWVGDRVKIVEERNSIRQWEHIQEGFTEVLTERMERQRKQRGISKGINADPARNKLQKYPLTCLSAQVIRLPKTILWR
jgi:hypothetical protein